MNINYEFVCHQGDLTLKIYEILKNGLTDAQTVIAGIGGDGTHCAIVNGMMKFKEENPDKQIPSYAIVPLGTANDIAKSFNIGSAKKISQAVMRRILLGALYGADYSCDLGKVAGKYFLDAFTVGVDAHILAGRDRDKNAIARNPVLNTFLKGYSIYVLNVIKSFSKCTNLNGTIEVDGSQIYSGKFYNIVINNTRIYAGEFDFTDSAIANDGLLDVLLFTGRRDYLIRYMLGNRHIHHKIRALSHKNTKFVQHKKGKIIKIKIEEPIKWQIDGESAGVSDTFTIETFPSAITLKIPVEPA